MKTLSSFEMVSIKNGIKVELQNGFRVHKAVENETFNLFMEYTEMMTNPEKYGKVDIECTVAALHKLADFWTEYCLHGESEARQKCLEKRQAEV